MITKQFLHISFNWVAPPAERLLKEQFDKALDWIRYAPNCWIVWTSRNPAQWFQRLQGLVGPKDNVFIVVIDLRSGHRAGKLPDWAWEWINQVREGFLPIAKTKSD